VDERTVELKIANEELVRINKENMELAELKTNMLQNELSKKEREMITAAVSIFQNKKFLSALKEDVFNEKIKYSKDQSAYLNRVIDKYDNLANSFNWELFEKRFTEIHQDFYVRLIKDYPELTTTDLKLCAFFHIGLSMKEIAILNYSNYEAVRKSVYRIRKKMRMDEKTELSIFLQGY
jgi:DNA-binding NarL/FixJ family response regulator